MQELGFLISQFVDGELNTAEKGKLFSKLSVNKEAGELFEEYLNLKKEMRTVLGNQVTEPLLLEKRKRNFNYKIAFYSSIAAVVALMIISMAGLNLKNISGSNVVESDFIQSIDVVKSKNLYLKKISEMETVKITDKDLVGRKL